MPLEHVYEIIIISTSFHNLCIIHEYDFDMT